MLRFLVWLTTLVVLAGAAPARAADADEWHASWATGMQGPFPRATVTAAQYALFGDEARNQTFRMIVRLSTGGTRVRIRLSNVTGSGPVTFGGVRVARRTKTSAVDPSTDRRLTFGGQDAVTIPAGDDAVSDPVELGTTAGQDLAVTFHVPGTTDGVTFHGTSFATSYISGASAGDIGANHNGAGFGFPTVSWFFVDRVDVAGGPARSTVVAFGDSLTDGFFTPIDSNERYPDLLAKALGPEFGVVNLGIGGNSISTARNLENDPGAGPPGILRWDRDALEAPGVDTVVLLEGINDVSIDADADTIQRALTSVTERAQAQGVCVIGATLLPRGDGPVPYGWNPEINEPVRQAVNDWMRSPAAPFDAVADTDAALRWNPTHTRRLRPEYDFGDAVHLNTAGRQAIVDALPLDVIRRCAEDPPPAAAACQDHVTIRLPRGLRRIRVDGRRVQRGTRRVRVDLRDRAGTEARVTVRARRASGRRYTRTRTVRVCELLPSR